MLCLPMSLYVYFTFYVSQFLRVFWFTCLTSLVVIFLPHMQYFSSISDALRSSGEGDRIVVHPGVYNESLQLDRPVQLIGAGMTSLPRACQS